MELLGWKIERKKEEEQKKTVQSFVDSDSGESSIDVSSVSGGIQSLTLDLNSSARSETDLINRYRSMSLQHEIEGAIDDVINEMIHLNEDSGDSVECNVDEIKFSDGVKKKIKEEFSNVLNLLDFNKKGYDIVKKWYIDGRLNYHAMIDDSKTKEGILELRYIDPRKIRKVREYETENLITQGNVRYVKKKIKNEYYVFSDTGFGYFDNKGKGFNPETIEGLKIANDAIIHCNSGIVNENNTTILSHLHKAYKPLNQLRIMEDASVIYRISRAPERRIFYIDTGRLPTQKAEQHLRNMMTRYKNKVSYNASTGELADDKNTMTMTDDFWFARPEGSQGTQVDTLQGGQNLGEMEDVYYFQKQLYKALNVPISRLEPDQGFSLGRASEITRDEIKFAKFITRLRSRFTLLFNEILEKQLILKNIINVEDWPAIKNSISYDFMKDNHYEEFKSAEILQERLNLLDRIDSYTGKYYSKKWIQKNVLNMTEDDIAEQEKEISKEKEGNEENEEFAKNFG